MLTDEMRYAAVDALLKKAEDDGLLDALDEVWARNGLLDALGLDDYKKTDIPLEGDPLEMLCRDAAERGRIDNTLTAMDLLDTRLMGILTPPPSRVIGTFRELKRVSPQTATDYFYALSRKSNYIRTQRVKKDLRWDADTRFGTLEISINLSKPEKDPKEIAAARNAKKAGYPACLLCVETEGFAGDAARPARQNHRVMPVEIAGQEWGFQYSPYVYYNEHCIVMNKEHVPMAIDDAVFGKLFSFVKQFPHYFVGSNADLPIVGGSILSHEHFQGGRHTFPMEKAPEEFAFTVAGSEGVHCAVVRYPMSVIRLRAGETDSLCRLAAKILKAWRSYSDESVRIFAVTDGVPHNTITPIARMRGGEYELDLVLRNNFQSKEHPDGEFHPYAELHHIKKENIGLIEVMGLAVLPGRLKKEMQALKEIMLSSGDPAANEATAKHAAWAKDILARRKDFNADNADEILKQEIGKVFAEVLACAGVFKCDEAGRAAFRRFVESVK